MAQCLQSCVSLQTGWLGRAQLPPPALTSWQPRLAYSDQTSRPAAGFFQQPSSHPASPRPLLLSPTPGQRVTVQSWEKQAPPQPRAGTPLSPLHPSSHLPSGVTLSATLTHPAQLSLSPSWCLRAGPPTEAQLPRPRAPPTQNPLWIPSRPCTCYSCFLEHSSTALPSQQLLDQPVRTNSTFYEAPPGYRALL